ncbi:MAG: alpha/beta fold hydrolase [Eubacteriales bacterium]|nr:alpha/beta fold hydrolase [Eubacteriales bacterium]
MMKAKWFWVLAGCLLLVAAVITGGVLYSMNRETKGTETVTFQAADGLTITGDLYRTGDKRAPFILLFHQAGYSRGEYAEIAPKLCEMGYNCLAIDQRSGGKCNGVTNETFQAARKEKLPCEYADAYPDLEAALKYATEQYKPKQLIVWGSSYSASLALILAAEHPGEVQAVLSFSPGEYFTRNDRTIADYARDVTQPVFITSMRTEEKAWKGIADSITSAGCMFFVPEGIGLHGSSALFASTKNNAEYWTAVERFLQSLKEA